MTDTLKVGLFDMAHLAEDDVAELRRVLPPTNFPALRRLMPWAVGFLVVAGYAVVRKLSRR